MIREDVRRVYCCLSHKADHTKYQITTDEFIDVLIGSRSHPHSFMVTCLICLSNRNAKVHTVSLYVRHLDSPGAHAYDY
jgi:hypothetical protein